VSRPGAGRAERRASKEDHLARLYATRGLELGLAFVMVVIGYTLLRPGDTFNQPAYLTLRTWVTEDAGGWIFVVTGMGRNVAILINSHWTATPAFRRGGCMIGGAFWLSAALALSAGDYGAASTPLLPRVCAAIFVFEAFFGIRTGMDVVTLDSFGLQRLAYRRKRRERDRADA
jgi:hypothetical protein